jgi:hypothetical protein
VTGRTTLGLLVALLALLALGAACRREAPSVSTTTSTRVAAPTPALPPPTVAPAARGAAPSPLTSGAAEQPAPPATAVGDEAVTDEDGPLVGEERERDPRSETVTIKVNVDARRKAHVLWGRKDFGEAPLEIVRPRNSGPLDLVVIATGCLPLHARAFTDRDDKLSLRLYAEAEAPQLLGYRDHEEAADKSVRGATQEMLKRSAK